MQQHAVAPPQCNDWQSVLQCRHSCSLLQTDARISYAANCTSVIVKLCTTDNHFEYYELLWSPAGM
jgi:hypothetical protein